jgi:ABC-type branched-subunit amino acid transport system substrate-binding protein
MRLFGAETRGRARPRWVGLGLIAIVILLAGCGSSSSSSSSSSSASAATTTTTPALTKSPIVTQTISSIGGQGPNYPLVFTVAKAYESYINSHGGIDGHPLQIDTCNEMDLPTAAVTCARQAVQDHVVASVGDYTLNGTVYVPPLTAANIPYVSSCCAQSAPELGNKNSYLVDPAIGLEAGMSLYAGEHCSHIDGVFIETPGDALQEKLINTFLSAYGKKLSSIIVIPAAAADISTQVAESKGADCMIMSLAASNLAAWLPIQKQLGLHYTILLAQGEGEPLVAQYPQQMDGSTIVANAFPVLSSPAWSVFRQQLASELKSPAGYAQMEDHVTENAWVAYTVFTAVAEQALASGQTLTGSSWMAAANKATDVSTGGLTPALNLTVPWTFPGFPRQFNRAVLLTKINGMGQKVAIGGFTDTSPLFQGHKPTTTS